MGFQGNQGPALPILTFPLQHQGSLGGLVERGGTGQRPGSLSSLPWPSPGAPVAQLTVVQQVADHFLAASADCVVQERATLTISVHEVPPSSVQLLELRAGGRAGLWLLWPSLSSHRNVPQLTGYRPGTSVLTHTTP